MTAQGLPSNQTTRLSVQRPEPHVEGVALLRPTPIADERGWFLRVFDHETYAAVGIDHTKLVQENHSRSRRGTLRGLHTRSDLAEAKLVRCARGRVYDVIVDLRPWSPTFLSWTSVNLDDELHHQVLVPAGCAHGFQALSEVADVCYRVTAVYDRSKDVALAWDDPDLAIPWPIADPLVSERDRRAPTLQELRPNLPSWFGSCAPGQDLHDGDAPHQRSS